MGLRPGFLQILQTSPSSTSSTSSFQVLVAKSGALQIIDGTTFAKIGPMMYDTVGRSNFDAAASSHNGKTIIGSTGEKGNTIHVWKKRNQIFGGGYTIVAGPTQTGSISDIIWHPRCVFVLTDRKNLYYNRLQYDGQQDQEDRDGSRTN